MMNKPEPNLIKQLNSPGWNLIEEQSDKRTTGTLSEVLTESHSRKSEGRSPGKIEQIETATRYAGYVAKQQADVARAAKAESTLIPADFDPDAIRALSFEVRHILKSRRPATIGEAARLPGVTPAAVSLLLVHVKKHRRAPENSSEPLPADA